MNKTILHQWFYNHSPERVWEYLTDATLLGQWLMPNDFKAEVGHQFTFNALPRPRFGFDGKIYCKVLMVEPLERISYSWRGGSGEKVTLDSVVTWTLTSRDGGTLLTLEHSGFKGVKNLITYLVMNKGWIKIAKRMETQLLTQLA